MNGPREQLDWESAPLRGLLSLAWPIAVSMVGYSVMTLVDTAFVGRLGASALAGVGLGGVMSFALLVFAIGLLRAVKILVSQAVGAGREADVPQYVAAGLAWALGLGLAVAALGQVVSLWVPVLAASAQAGEYAALYLRIRILSAPVFFVYVTLRETAYGAGDSRSPMIASLVANAVNIALDYTLIYGADLGVAGAAWASVAAHVTEAAIMVRRNRRLLSALQGYRLRMRDIWNIGVPTGLQFVVEVGAFTALTAIVSRISELDMAAHQIALNAIHFSFLPALSVGEAASVMTGQAVGANRYELVREISVRAMWVAGIYTGLCTVLFGLGAPYIGAIFTSDPSVIAKASGLLYVAAVFQIADGANIVARSVLRGTGDVRFPAVFAVITAWVVTPPMCWLIGLHFGMGAIGGWFGLCVEIMIGATVLWIRLWRGGWIAAADRSRSQVTRQLEVAA